MYVVSVLACFLNYQQKWSDRPCYTPNPSFLSFQWKLKFWNMLATVVRNEDASGRMRGHRQGSPRRAQGEPKGSPWESGKCGCQDAQTQLGCENVIKIKMDRLANNRLANSAVIKFIALLNLLMMSSDN